jgi:hypothetical protein
MEPQQNEVESVIAPLKKVTPLSKYLAMVLFIILPFIGGWIGYTLAPERVVEVERVVAIEVDEKISTGTDQMKVESDTAEWETFVSMRLSNKFSFEYPSVWALTPGSGSESLVYVGDVNPVFLSRDKENQLNSFEVLYGTGGCSGLESPSDNPVVISGISGKDSLWRPSMLGECREIQFENNITISMDTYEAEQKEVLEKILSTFKFVQ